MRRQYALVFLSLAGGLGAQTASPVDDTNNDRILKIIPNYQTVSEPTPATPPLTTKQKWGLFVRESTDPFNIASAALGAAISQGHNSDPKYGVGMSAYGQRLGAALADETSQEFFSDAILASWWHQDPRYFRKGPGSSVMARSFYAISRVFVCRTDSGRSAGNWSNLAGTALGIGLSNVYYPRRSITVSENGSRFVTSLSASAFANLLPEFWPDIRKKFLHKTDHSTTP
jgi:hypothetical protein